MENQRQSNNHEGSEIGTNNSQQPQSSKVQLQQAPTIINNNNYHNFNHFNNYLSLAP